MKDALVVEHEFNAARCTQVSACLIKIGTDIGNRSCSIVRGGFYEYGNPMGPVPFVNDFLVISLVFFVCSANGPFNIVFGHVFGAGVLNDGSQTGIILGIRTSL